MPVTTLNKGDWEIFYAGDGYYAISRCGFCGAEPKRFYVSEGDEEPMSCCKRKLLLIMEPQFFEVH